MARALNAAGGWNTKGDVPCAIHAGFSECI